MFNTIIRKLADLRKLAVCRPDTVPVVLPDHFSFALFQLGHMQGNHDIIANMDFESPMEYNTIGTCTDSATDMSV